MSLFQWMNGWKLKDRSGKDYMTPTLYFSLLLSVTSPTLKAQISKLWIYLALNYFLFNYLAPAKRNLINF